MLQIDPNYNITLTRGDTGLFSISLINKDGEEYIPEVGSSLRFAMSKTYGSTDENVVLKKNIPIETMQLVIEPADTKDLDFGSFVYDIELTDNIGQVSTVVMAKFTVSKEVY